MPNLSMLYKKVVGFNPAIHIVLRVDKSFDLEKLTVYESYLFSVGVISSFIDYEKYYKWFEGEIEKNNHFYLTNFIVNDENEVIIANELLTNYRSYFDTLFYNSIDIKDHSFTLSKWNYDQFIKRFSKTGEIIQMMNEINKNVKPKMYL